MAIIYVLMENV